MTTYQFLKPTEITGQLIQGYRDLINAEVGGGIGYTTAATQDKARELMESFSQEGSNLLVALQEGAIVGSGVLSRRSSPVQQHVGDIRKVVVHPNYRGQRIGQEIMTHLEQRARDIDLEILVLDVRSHLPAVHLYKKIGFEDVGTHRGLSKVGDTYFDILLMQKNLKK